LFCSIRPIAKSLGLAGQPQWHIMSATQSAAETNAWDLCHNVVTQGFGVAGLQGAQFAEPDLEQQWISGSAIQHALAASRPCDGPVPPDTRLPAGPGFQQSLLYALKRHLLLGKGRYQLFELLRIALLVLFDGKTLPHIEPLQAAD
jgi:hypothetical protein